MPARVCVLGPVELLTADGTPVPLAPRVRRLLAGLAAYAGAVSSVDRLAEIVWGDDVPDHPGNAVQTLVSRLRRGIRDSGGGPQVLTRPEGYVLLAAAECFDSVAFRGLLARARAAALAENRIAILTEAVGLWRGAAYGLLADEWFAREEAVALGELRTGAVVDLAEAELAAGQPGAAQERLTMLMADHPYDERPALLLMDCLRGSGRTGEALAVYADLRRRLRDDLGLEPSAAAVAAQRALLRPAPGAPVVGLPMPVDLVGRGGDERALAALLGSGRLVTVLGPGGVGKTTLTARVARLAADDFRDGVVGVELGRLEPGDAVAVAVGTVLQLPAGTGTPIKRLVDRLRDRELLLVLDNCEHLVAEVASIVDRLLAACPGLTVLATSRVSLRLGDERVFRLEPLAEDAAVELFRRHARQRLRSYDPAADDLATVASLCHRLDGLPLAIELAASRVDVISPHELLDRWSWHQSVLRGARGDARHRSLTALVDWSYERLPADVQRVFEGISIFAGDFSLGDATDLLTRLGDTQDPGWSLTTLVDSSMVTRSPATGRLRLLETLRSYGRLRLAERGTAAAVATAHAELFADRAVAGRAQLYEPGHPGEVRRLLCAVDELRTAFGWSLENRPATAARIAGGMALVVEHALLGEAVDWADAVLAAGETSDPWVWAVAAGGARFVGDLDRAAALADRAISQAGDDRAAESYALLVRADVALFAGDADTVRTCLTAAHGRIRPMVALTALLSRHYNEDPVDPAEAREIRQDAERQGRSVIAAWAQYVEGELQLDADPGRAYGLLAAALQQARGFGDEYLTGVALVSAASAAQRSGRLEEARRLFADVVRHWRLRGDLIHQWTTLRNVVELLAATGQPEEALSLGAALLVVERDAAGFGADAARLAATVGRLRELVGTRSADLVSRARGLRDDQVIDDAVSALGRVDQVSR